MKKRTRKTQKASDRLSLKLFIVSVIITIGIAVVQDYRTQISQKIIESQNDANFRALLDIAHGGDTSPIRHVDGTYGVGFNRALKDSVNMQDCVIVIVARANGTVETPILSH